MIDIGVKVEKVFITNPDSNPKIIPTVDLAQENSIPVVVLGKKDLMTIFVDMDAEIICFSAGFKYIFPPKFVKYFNLILNVHGTLLPHYAGLRTLNWIIENGEQYSGVTIHGVDCGIDTGPILVQKSFAITPFDTGRSLYRKTLEFEPYVVEEALKMINEGRAYFTTQASTNVTIYPNRSPEHSKIDPSKPLVDLVNSIRAADVDFYPAFFEYHGYKLGVKLFRLYKQSDDDEL